MNNFDPYAPNPLAGTGDIPANAIGVVTFPNRNGQGKYLWNWNKLNFAPRFGFAWRPLGNNDTVVRGGFGMFFGDSYDREIIQELRLGFGTTYTARIPVPTSLKDGLPAGALDDVPASAVDADLRHPRHAIRNLADPVPRSESQVALQHEFQRHRPAPVEGHSVRDRRTRQSGPPGDLRQYQRESHPARTCWRKPAFRRACAGPGPPTAATPRRSRSSARTGASPNYLGFHVQIRAPLSERAGLGDRLFLHALDR